MATWTKNAEDQIVVDFEELDLTISKITLTKNILTEVIDYPVLKLEVKNIHECDSAGLQLLLLFYHEVDRRNGKVIFSSFSSEMEGLCRLLGIEGTQNWNLELATGGNHV